MIPEKVKKEIQQSYSQYLKEKSLNARHGQKLMIAAIARSIAGISLGTENERLSEGHVCVVEAGTGTGKTVAYLLAALPVAKYMGKKIVVSTATVALQEQIVFKDLPDIRKHSGLDFDYTLAKGRGRYLCLSKLDRILDSNTDDPMIPLYEVDNAGVSSSDVDTYNTMINQLSTGGWDGDRDSWPEELEAQTWSRVTTDHRQCTGRRCDHIRHCAFFKARESLDYVDCIVANHDLVLADLALGGGAILSKPEDTIYIFDEAHHLPEKALNHFSSSVRIVSTTRWLGQTEGQWSSIISPLSEVPYIMQIAAPIEALLKDARHDLDQLHPLLAPYINEVDRSQSTPRYRFSEGQVDETIELRSRELEKSFTDLFRAFEKLAKEIGEQLEDENSPVPKVDLEQLFGLVGGWCTRAEANLNCWRSYSRSQSDSKWPIARWITLIDLGDGVDFELVSSPVLASHTLNKHLWERCCGAIATSATLTALGSFERFQLRSGTPENSLYEVVPSPFNYRENAILRVPHEAVEANNADAHTESIIRLLPDIIDREEGTLVLFSSRRQMLQVFEELPETLRERILMQGEDSKQTLLTQHRKRIDEKQGSILFGLASFAEGLDLPGEYCKHVVIAKIPFAVPDDPVESAMAEWVEAQGGNAFMQLAVPDAAIKLVQACGRLLRTETDTGVVTVLDKRLITKRYGSAILESLPPFKLDLNASI